MEKKCNFSKAKYTFYHSYCNSDMLIGSYLPANRSTQPRTHKPTPDMTHTH